MCHLIYIFSLTSSYFFGSFRFFSWQTIIKQCSLDFLRFKTRFVYFSRLFLLLVKIMQSTLSTKHPMVNGYCGAICAGNDNCQKMEMGRHIYLQEEARQVKIILTVTTIYVSFVAEATSSTCCFPFFNFVDLNQFAVAVVVGV